MTVDVTSVATSREACRRIIKMYTYWRGVSYEYDGTRHPNYEGGR